MITLSVKEWRDLSTDKSSDFVCLSPHIPGTRKTCTESLLLYLNDERTDSNCLFSSHAILSRIEYSLDLNR